MKCIGFILMLLLLFEFGLFSQTTIIFQHKNNEHKIRKMKFKGIEHLEFRTKDSTIHAENVLNVNDSLLFCADGNKVEFTISLSKIVSIKKYNSSVEGTGYIFWEWPW